MKFLVIKVIFFVQSQTQQYHYLRLVPQWKQIPLLLQTFSVNLPKYSWLSYPCGRPAKLQCNHAHLQGDMKALMVLEGKVLEVEGSWEVGCWEVEGLRAYLLAPVLCSLNQSSAQAIYAQSSAQRFMHALFR
jgi:hypothetical protein